MFDINDPAGGSGVTIQIILNGENATQQFQQVASQIEDQLNQFNKQVQKTNDLLKTAFSTTKVDNFAKQVENLANKVRVLNTELNNLPTEKLAALAGAPVTGAAKADSTKEGSAQATKVAASNKGMVDSYTNSFQASFFQTMDKGFTQHTVSGVQSLIKVFGTAASWIGRIRVLAQSAVKMVINLIKSPFTLISGLLQKVSNAMGSIFKAFEWVQYQLFMQFMNVWLFSKTLMPVIQTFIDYNREIYQTWALVKEEWGSAFNELKANLASIDLSKVTDDVEGLGVVLDNVLGERRDATLVDLLSDLGTAIAREYGKLPQDIASAFYQMASATMEFEDVADTTILAAKASIAGVTSLTTSMDAGIQAAYAFGTSMSDLNKIYDLQFQTVKYGIMRYEELAEVMGRVYQPAASLSESLANMQEMYATIAFATRVGLSPEMAGFGMGRLYESFSDTRVVENLKKINIQVFDSIGNFRGLYNIVNDLVFVVKGYSTSVSQTILSNLGFDMRARRVLRALITNFAAYTQVVTAFGTELDDVMSRAYETMTESFAFKIDKLKASWDTLKISVLEASIDTLNTFIDKISFGIKALIGWLQEGEIYIGKFSASIGSIVKYSATFFMMFAVIASFAGIIRAALTPTGLFVAAIAVLLRDAAKGGKIIQYLSQNFSGLAAVLKTITTYIKIFVDLLRSSDTPIAAFGKVFNLMFADLNTLLLGEDGISSLKKVVTSFKSLFTSLKGVFDPTSYVDALRSFSDETNTFTDKIGMVIAYRFGKVFNAVGASFRDFLVAAFDITGSNTGTVLGDAIQKTYKFIMQVFAGIFGKSPENFGLMSLFSSILEAFGVLVQNKFGELVLNKNLISSIGNTFANLLGEVIKGYFTNFNLVLTITGFNIVKEATYGLFKTLSNLQAQAIKSETFGGKVLSFAGDVLKYRAILEFVEVLLPPDLAEKLKGPVGEVVKWALSMVIAYFTTMFRVQMMGSAVEKAMRGAMQAASVTIHTPVVYIFTSQVINPSSPFEPVSGKVASKLSKNFIVSMVGMTITALVGAGGLLSGLFAGEKTSPVENLSAQMQVQSASNNAIISSLREVSSTLSDSSKETANIWKAVALTAGISVVAGLTAGAAVPLIAAVGAKTASGLTALFGLIKSSLAGRTVAGALGAISPKLLAGLVVRGTAAINLLPFAMSIKTPETTVPTASLDLDLAQARAINAELQKAYTRDTIARLGLDADLSGIMFDMAPALLEEKTSMLVPQLFNYADSINKYASTFSEKGEVMFVAELIRELDDLSDWFGNTIMTQIEELAIVDLDTLFRIPMTFKEFANKLATFEFEKGTGGTGLKSITNTIVRSTDDFFKSMPLGSIFDTYSDILELVFNQIKQIDIDKVTKYARMLKGLERFYGLEQVSAEFEGIIFAPDTDLDAVFAGITANLEKYALSMEDKVEYLRSVNKLYATYFADVVSELDVVGSTFKTALAENEGVQNLLKDVVTVPTETSIGDYLKTLPLSQILDYIKNLSASEEVSVASKAKAIMGDILANLQTYAGNLINVEDHLEFFKLLWKVDNYINYDSGKMLKQVYDLKEYLVELTMPTQESVKEIKAVSDILDGIIEIDEIVFSVDWWKKILSEKFSSTSKAYASKAIAETIATVVVNSIVEALNTQTGVESLGLGKVFSANTQTLLAGTKYATSFKDPYEVFAEYAVKQFTSAIGGTSKVISMPSEELFKTITAFVAKTFPTEGLAEGQGHIANFNKAMQELTVEYAKTGAVSGELLSEFTTLAKTYLNDDMAKFIEEFGKVFTELDIMNVSKQYSEAFELMFTGSMEEVIGAVSTIPELAEVLITTVKEVQDAINAARRNLASTKSVASLAFEGVAGVEMFRDFKASFDIYSSVVGGLFGRGTMLGGLYADLTAGFAYSMERLKAEARSYDFSKETDITDFVNANAKLLIDLGLFTEEQYLHTVATGLWEAGDSKSTLNMSRMKDILETEIYTVADQYTLFMERQIYFMTELQALADDSIAKMSIPEMVVRLKGVWDNLVYWFQNDIINVFNPFNWATVAAEGIDISTIIRKVATITRDNLANIFLDPEEFEKGYQNIFDTLKTEVSDKSKFKFNKDLWIEAFDDSMVELLERPQLMFASASRQLALDAGLVGASSTEWQNLYEGNEGFREYVDLNVKALGEIQDSIRKDFIGNLASFGKGLVSEYSPTNVELFGSVLDLPIIGGALNILTDIASNFVGNYLYFLIEGQSATWLISLSDALGTLNIGATGEPILSDKELVTLSKDIIVDGLRFAGQLLKLPFELLAGKTTFDKFIGDLSFENVMPETVKFINTLGEESKKIVSEFIVGGIKNLDFLQPLGELLTKYKALDDKTEEEAIKLVEGQWEILKDFTADVLGINKWIVNLLDLGLFRGGIIKLIANMLPVIEDVQKEVATTGVPDTVSSNVYASIAKFPRIDEVAGFLEQAELVILNLIADRIDKMAVLSIDELEKETIAIMESAENIEFYSKDVRAKGKTLINRDLIREQAVLLSNTLTDFTVRIGDNLVSGLMIYNAAMSGILGPLYKSPLSLIDITNVLDTTETFSEYLDALRDKLNSIENVPEEIMTKFMGLYDVDLAPALQSPEAMMEFLTIPMPTDFLSSILSKAQDPTQAMNLLKGELDRIGKTIPPEEMNKLMNFYDTFMTSLLPALTPQDINKLFPSIPIPSDVLNAQGEWLNQFSQMKFLFATLDEEKIKVAIDYLNSKMNYLSESLQMVGSSFSSIGESLKTGSEEFGWGLEYIAKIMSSVGVAATAIEGVTAGWKNVNYWGAAFSTALSTGGDIVSSTLGLAGGWGQIASSILQGVLALYQIWQESTKITEQQLIAIRQNTVALDSLTNILDSLQATVYGAPEGFIYGYANPTKLSEEPIATTMYMPTSKEPFTVNISINAANMDANEVASAVEDGVYKAYKRLR